MSAMYPERELWFANSAITGTTGTAVDMTNFVQDRGSAVIVAPPGLTAPVTVTFETADADPANACLPAATWTAMNQGGLCDAATPLSVTINPADAAYSATFGQICRIPLQCRSAFVRAKLSVATAGLSVMIVGKAARLASL